MRVVLPFPTLGLTVAAALLVGAAAVRAQGGARPTLALATPPPGHSEARPRVLAEPRRTAVRLDGRLDEPDWTGAVVATDFVQQDPHEGQPATQRTEVRFLYDDQALYIGARMYDTGGRRGVHSRLVRRDQQTDGDYLELVFDTYHDHAGRTIFQVNPAGSKTDAGQAAPNADPSWDPVWDVVTAVDSLGWTAEMRIPWSQLRYPRDSVQTWGMQIWRYEERLNETSMWAFWGKAEQGGPQRFGHLEDLRIPGRARGVELMPYAVSRAAYVRPSDPGSPFQSARDYSWRAGGDVKALLTSTLTLDATVNPDFGQVEADPAVVNLSAFEISFPEKRPFFVEGSGLFGFGGLSCYFCSNASGMSLFYSRRIGRPPHGSAPDSAQHAEQPQNTTILAAAKVTGRTASGLQVGLLEATTAAENVHFIQPSGATGVQQVEPFTNYFVARLKKNMRGGRLQLGTMATSVVRDLNDPTLRDLLPAHAEALGTDWELTWKSQMYDFRGNLAVSNVQGDDSALARIQRSSARYLQRPDRGDHHNGLLTDAYDPSLTALRGVGGYARIAKQEGVLRWDAQVNFRSPGFEVNDLAFLSRADYVWTNGNLWAYWSKPKRWYRTFELIAGGQDQYNFEGDRTATQVHGYVGAELPNYWYVNAFVIQRPGYFDDRLTRGGPVVRAPGSRSYFLNVNTDSRKAVLFGLHPDYTRGADGTGSYDLAFETRVRLASNLNLDFQPTFSHNASRLQYVTSFTDPTATSFYGQRTVFADIAQNTLSLDTRVSATFTPNLTLELYAQPFVGSGAYSRFKEFLRPRSAGTHVFDAAQLQPQRDATGAVTSYSLDPDADPSTPVFSFANPDFSVRSLLGNAVLRWEWRPGSTLFLVWQQSRATSESFGDFDLGRDLGGVFRQRADNIFLLKVSYWLGR